MQVGRLVEALHHRGPDARGTWVSESNRLALGHTRLAIQDLSAAGAQPMGSRCGRFHVVLNGEIYNHLELRERLGHGDDWRGHSDTETLVEAISQWGIEKALREANGMFALAAWDAREERLYLARDRIGEKPLYWGVVRGVLVFASELGAILTSGLGPFELDHDAISMLFDLGYIPDPYSAVREIHKLEPARILTVSRVGQEFSFSERTYWSLAETVDSALARRREKSADEWLEEVEHALKRAVKLRLLSDVPLGTFLSGGVDSGLITAMMASVSTEPVRTFTINIPGSDEADRAKRLSEHLGTTHTSLQISEQDCLDIIPGLPEIYSEPFGDSSQVPTYLVSKLARSHVTVALSGDGGDELFAGYHRHFMARRIWAILGRTPMPARKLLSSVLHSGIGQQVGGLVGRALSDHGRREGRALRFHKGLKLAGSQSVEDLYRNLVVLWPDNVGRPSGLGSKDIELPGWIAEHEDLDPVERLMLYDVALALPGDMLVKVDRAAMAHALETRIPFLDHEFMELAFSVPVSLKVRNGKGKWLLKELLSRHAPSGWMSEPKASAKIGFGMPIYRWMRGELREWGESLLRPDSMNNSGMFDAQRIWLAWGRLQSGTLPCQHAMWSILMFQAWMAHYRHALRV